MTTNERDEFYVGYLPKAPPRTARRIAIVVVMQVFASIIAGAAMAWAMRSPGPGTWDVGTPRTVEGTLLTAPYPLIVDDRGHTILLVDFGKRGAQERVSGLSSGTRVRATGYPLERDGRSMIELAPDAGAIAAAGGAPAVPSPPASQVVSLRGEIVDPKCFLGAMKPGEGKTHKACAARCISGGIPPMLVCWDPDGRPMYLLLATTENEPLAGWVLPFVGDAVEVRGRLTSIGDLPMLLVGSEGVRRIGSEGPPSISPMIGAR